jgi:hypothetical protein
LVNIDEQPQDHGDGPLTSADPHAKDLKGLSAFVARKLNANSRVVAVRLKGGRLTRLATMMRPGRSPHALP